MGKKKRFLPMDRYTDYESYYRQYSLLPRIGVVKTTPMDRALGRSVSIPADDTRQELNKSQSKIANLPVFRDLLADAFFMYFLNEPEPVDPESLPFEYRISQLLLTWMATQPDAEIAKTMTTSSAPASTAAALFSWRAMMSDEAFESLRKAMQQLQNMKQDIDKQKNHEESSPDNQPQSSQGDGDGDDEQEQPQSHSAKMEQEYEEKAKKVEDAVQRMMSNPVTNGAMRENAKQSRKKIENLSALAQSWGMELGSLSVSDITSIMKLYSDNQGMIEQLATLIGRAEIASSSALQRVRESYIGTPSQISLTQDLSQVLPFERILLSESTPHIIRTQQVLDWVNQGLLGWVDEGEGKTQGSFVAYVDGSGSMSGDKSLTAKAIAFGLAKTLHEDRYESRAYVIKTFGTRVNGFLEVNETSKLDKIAEWASESPGGGTDFNYCFEDCLITMQALEERDILGTDLVFITDGEATLEQEHIDAWREHVARTGSRVIFVLVPHARSTRYAKKGIAALESIADLVIEIDTEQFKREPEKVIDQIMNIVAIERKDEYER